MPRILYFKYPKFLLLLFTFIFAYLIFRGSIVLPFENELLSLGYVGTFITGIFYSFGLTSGPAIAIILLFAGGQNLVLTALVAGAGALLGDLTIFRFIRYSFDDEIKTLSNEKLVTSLTKKIPPRIGIFLWTVAAFLIIGSPLPDEIGVSMLTSVKNLPQGAFMALTFVLNTAGILSIAFIAACLGCL